MSAPVQRLLDAIPDAWRRPVGWAMGTLLAWPVAAALLPNGLPVGIYTGRG